MTESPFLYPEHYIHVLGHKQRHLVQYYPPVRGNRRYNSTQDGMGYLSGHIDPNCFRPVQDVENKEPALPPIGGKIYSSMKHLETEVRKKVGYPELYPDLIDPNILVPI